MIIRSIPNIMKRRIHQALKTTNNLALRIEQRRRYHSLLRSNSVKGKSSNFLTKKSSNYYNKKQAFKPSLFCGSQMSLLQLLSKHSKSSNNNLIRSNSNNSNNNNSRNINSKRNNHGSANHNHGSHYSFVLAPELVGLEREAKRLHEEHMAASEPFNMAFDKAFEKLPDLANKSELNILEIGFGSGACISGIFDYFENNNKKNSSSSSSSSSGASNAQRVIIRGIDNEPWWYDFCKLRFKNEIENKDLYLHQIDATQIEKLLDVNYNNFDIILFRFVLAHVMNYESVFKYIVRYLLTSQNDACVMIQDGLPPNAYAGVTSHASLLPHMTNKNEFPNLYKFIHETVPPVMDGVMRFDVPYVLPQLLEQCGMKKIWENEQPFGGVNGTQGFNMAVENLASTVTRFKLLGYISENEERSILQEIDYARKLPESRSYVMMPMITTVATKKKDT